MILIIGRIVAGGLARMAKRAMEKGNAESTLTNFTSRFIKIAVLAFVLMAALSALGVQTASLVAIIGAAGLAIGFALQSTLSNFAAGIILVIFKPFKCGDYINAAGESGTVIEIRIFNTVLKTFDNVKIVLPNGNITGSCITNYSAMDTRRIDMVFGIGADDDLKKAKDLLIKIIKEDERILEEPAPEIRVIELADSSVNFGVRPWVKRVDFWATKCDLIEKIKLEFDEAGISIPYPQTDVHLFKKTG